MKIFILLILLKKVWNKKKAMFSKRTAGTEKPGEFGKNAERTDKPKTAAGTERSSEWIRVK